MNINGKPYKAIWRDDDGVKIIDQRVLPFELKINILKTSKEAIIAIKDMAVRGAPLIGATGGYAVYLAAKNLEAEQDFLEKLKESAKQISLARPTAIDLNWAVARMLKIINNNSNKNLSNLIILLKNEADAITKETEEMCYNIGINGLPLLEEISKKKKGETINILTHCNAGWIATVDWGTATAPIYLAHKKGIKLHVWVDETRPRNQGARLTAWELGSAGIPHTVIADNTGGLLMKKGMVDCVITGTDRTTKKGDVCNKIGTYLKALAAYDNNIPFYVALPTSTFDWQIEDAFAEIPIETRSENEVKYIQGYDQEQKKVRELLITPESSPALNYGFDITPAKYVTGLITDKGFCNADEESIKALYPEYLK